MVKRIRIRVMSSLNITCRLSTASVRLRSEISRAINDIADDGAVCVQHRRDRQRHLYRDAILREPLRFVSLDSLAGKSALPNGLRFAE